MLRIRVHHILVPDPYIRKRGNRAGPASPPDLPAAAGVYYRQGEAGWVYARAGRHGGHQDPGHGSVPRYLRVVKSQPDHGVSRARSQPSGFLDQKPVFYVRGVGTAQDVLIVQLAKKKDTREIQASSTNASVNNKEGFKRGSLYRVSSHGTGQRLLQCHA